MRKIKNSSRELISTLPNKLNQTLIDGYRVKLFSKIKDSLEKKKIALEQEQVQFQEWLEDKNFINQPINNTWFIPFIRA